MEEAELRIIEEGRIASLLPPEMFARSVRTICATCGKDLIYWADGRWIHEDRTVDHMAKPVE